MSDSTTTAPVPKVPTARELNASFDAHALWDFPIYANELPWHPAACVFKCHRMDLTRLLFSGTIPVPLLEAALKVDRLAAAKGDADAILREVGETNGPQFLDALYAYGCQVIAEPKVSRDGTDLDALHIERIPAGTLIRLMMSEPPMPRLSEVDATSFRRAEPDAPGADVSDGESLRTAAVDLAVDGTGGQPTDVAEHGDRTV